MLGRKVFGREGSCDFLLKTGYQQTRLFSKAVKHIVTQVYSLLFGYPSTCYTSRHN
jgi:hypothetical protein